MARSISVNVFEEFGHIEITHTQSRAQHTSKFLSADALVIIGVKELKEMKIYWPKLYIQQSSNICRCENICAWENNSNYKPNFNIVSEYFTTALLTTHAR